MAWRIVKQPNGKLARFSDIVEAFTHYDMTVEEALEVCREEGLSADAAAIKVKAGVEDHKPWTNGVIGSGRDRWDDSLKSMRMVHGDEEFLEDMANMGFLKDAQTLLGVQHP